MTPEPNQLSLIDDPNRLAEISDRISDSRLLAIDTEFVREKTYFPELCVVQVATDDTVFAVDCLAELDLDPLIETLFAAGKTWLLHSARQDLEVLYYLARKLPTRLIDTQTAAALCGMPAQVGLQSLLEEALGVAIGKQHTRADWSRRPLPHAQLDYALDDVRYLIPLWHELEGRLQSLGRESWVTEECARQLSLPIEPTVETLFDKTKGTGALDGDARAAGFALLAWREERARAANRPRRWILADDQLVKLANALPESMGALKRLEGIPPRILKRSGAEIVEAIKNRGPSSPAPIQPVIDKARVKQLQERFQSRARSLGIQPELLATKRDLTMIAIGRMPSPFVEGWRHGVTSDIIASV